MTSETNVTKYAVPDSPVASVDITDDKEWLTICFKDGSSLEQYHDEESYETVRIEDITGDINDLVGHPLVVAESVRQEGKQSESGWESTTWTFVKFGNVNATVTIRWLGGGNGYYSETPVTRIFDATSEDVEQY